jgi:hypothetical protein
VYAGVDVCKGAMLLCCLLRFAKGFEASFSVCIEGRLLCGMQEVHRKLDDISRKSYDDETFDDDDDDDGDGDDDDDGDQYGDGDGDDGAYDDESDRYSSDSVDVESAAATSTHLPRDCSTLLGCAACGDIRRATEMMNDQPASFAIEIDQRDSQVSPQNQT